MDWELIETAPKDGSEFLATNGILLGVGCYYRHVEPATVTDSTEWTAYYKKVRAPFKFEFVGGRLPPGVNYLENARLEEAAWEAAKQYAPEFEQVPNPKAGEVRAWYHASAFHAFDGISDTEDYDGPIGFTPTHWMPIPTKP